MSYKTLQEKAKAKGKLLLIESVAYLPKAEDIIVFTSKDNKFTEAKNGKQYEARGILKNVPVTRYTENANGRIYSKALWENVAKSDLFEGSDALANHAEDDGNVLDQVGVWHNFQVGEDTATADLYCIGAAGNLLLEKVKAGGKTGFSTVGFGELNESDGKTVKEDSFEYCQTDWVMRPSQSVYATQENLNESTEIKKENKIIENNFTNKIEEKQIKMVEVKKMDKLLEMSVRNQIKATIKEAIANENYAEAIKELKEVSETIDPTMADMKEMVEGTIVKIQNKLVEMKETAHKELKESKETLETVTAKYNAACDTIKELTGRLEKASKIVEKATDKDTVKSLKRMEEDINQFCIDRELMESDIAILQEEIANRDADLKIYASKLVELDAYKEDTDLREKDIAKFKEERVKMKKRTKTLEKQLKEAEKHIKGLEKMLKEDFGYDFEDEYVDDTMDNEVYDDFSDDDIFADEDEYIYEAEEEDSDEDEEELEEEDDEDEEELEEEEDDEEDEEDDDDKMAAVRAAKKEAIRRKKQAEMKKAKAKSKPTVKESTAPRKEIIEYYKAAVQAKPAVKDIQKEVLASKSLLEAVKKVNMFETKFGNDIHKLNESKTQKQEFVPYKFKI